MTFKMLDLIKIDPAIKKVNPDLNAGANIFIYSNALATNSYFALALILRVKAVPLASPFIPPPPIPPTLSCLKTLGGRFFETSLQP